jgi:CRISPR-associated protein Csx17
MPDLPENEGHELAGQHPPLATASAARTASAALGAQPGTGLAEHGLRGRTGEPGTVAGATRAPDDATRHFDTAQGRLSYTELAERLAEPLQRLDLRIRAAEFTQRPLDDALLLDFHRELSGELFPDDAARLRTSAVHVGAHEPPDATRVPGLIRDYTANLAEQLRHVADADERIIELLAYAEGELLTIHPFRDLNGRISRLWLLELLTRLGLPAVDIAPPAGAFRSRYLAALAAWDRRDRLPLQALWRERLGQPAALNDIVLPGCTPTPLASYLKALAVLRLVAEDAERGDPEATGYWRNDQFVLRTKLTKAQLCEFFLDHWKPTPLISPWNGRAGFLEGEDEETDDSAADADGNHDSADVEDDSDSEDEASGGRIGVQMVNAFTRADIATRFEAIEAAIKTFQGIEALGALNTGRSREKDLKSQIDVKRKAREAITQDDEDRLTKLKADNARLKATVLLRLRNEADVRWLRWFDACQVLAQTSDVKAKDRNKPLHAPLLGKGGVDGSMDFGVNQLKRLTQLFDLNSAKPLQPTQQWLAHALFGTATTLTKLKPGQFNAGAGSFPNSGTGFSGEPVGNPWDALLALEGAVLFAATTSRRLESGDEGKLAAPFTVRSRATGSGAVALRDDADRLTNAEIWVPLWRNACSFDELQALLAEGRTALGTRNARDGLDFARAVTQLGINRGITSFQRFGFLKRSGKSYIGTPLSRVRAERNPKTDPTRDLERRGWLDQVRQFSTTEEKSKGFKPSPTFRAVARQLDTALFSLAQSQSRNSAEAALRQIGRIESLASLSENVQKQVKHPISPLGLDWAELANDGSTAFNVAAALAGLKLVGTRIRNGKSQRIELTARNHLAYVDEAGREWDNDSRLAGWSVGPIESNLAALLHRRRLEAQALGQEGELLASCTGATCADLEAFLRGDTDDRRVAELLGGLACVDLDSFPLPRSTREAALPPAFVLLKVLFTPESQLHAIGWLPREKRLRLPAEIPARLTASRPEAAVRIAWARLRALGVKLPGRNGPSVISADGPRWLAALCIPLTDDECTRMLGYKPLTLKGISPIDSRSTEPDLTP